MLHTVRPITNLAFRLNAEQRNKTTLVLDLVFDDKYISSEKISVLDVQ
jgi:hypothetical protein